MCQRLQLPVMLDTDDAGACYLLAGEWMPGDEEIREAFDLSELLDIHGDVS